MSLEREVAIVNRLGLHARAAARFVTLATHYASDIQVRKGEHQVNGKSIMGVMMLAAACGSRITLIAQGSDEQQALEALSGLVARRFEEPA